VYNKSTRLYTQPEERERERERDRGKYIEQEKEEPAEKTYIRIVTYMSLFHYSSLVAIIK
jgi:hypothetical protein